MRGRERRSFGAATALGALGLGGCVGAGSAGTVLADEVVEAPGATGTGFGDPVRAINVNPGLIDTGMQAAIRASSAEDFPAVGLFIQRKTDGELRAPSVVAEAVARMVDDERLEGGARASVEDYLR